MGYTNKPPGEKSSLGETIVPVILFIIFLGLLIFGIIQTSPKCPLQLVTKVDKYDETVREVTFHNSFWDGKHCIVVTNKNFYTMRGSNCISNEVGEQFTYTYGEYVEVCEGEDK